MISNPASVPNPKFARVAKMLAESPGYAMLTILLYDVEKGQGRRVFSTDHENYPEGDFKPIPTTDWGDQVLVRQKNFVAHTVADFRPHYGDWEKLEAMGLVSGMNLPVVVSGRTLGSINLTATIEGFYTAEREAQVAQCHAEAAEALLAETGEDAS